MKCTLISENFKRALTLTERSTSKDLTLPILSSFLISADKNILKIIGTNLEIGIETSLRGSIQEAGKIAVPAKILLSYISTLPKDQKITIESNGNDLTIQTDVQKTIFKGYQGEDFPPFPTPEELFRVRLKKDNLIQVLSKTLISTSKSNIKPELASIFFLLERGVLTIASTDSFRLTEERLRPIAQSSKNQKETFLLPSRTAEELIKILEYGDQQEVDLALGKGEILIKYNDTALYSRLTEGSFPEYQPLIPKKYITTMILSKKTFIGHIRRASIFTNKLNGITLRIRDNGECEVEGINRDIGEYRASFKADIKGSPITIVFNYHYLLEGLESFQEDQLLLGFNNESQPLLIRPVPREDTLYIVMPMKGTV